MYQGKEDTHGQEDKFRFYFMQTNVGKQISFKSLFIISQRNIFIYKYWKLDVGCQPDLQCLPNKNSLRRQLHSQGQEKNQDGTRLA
jgi:hypothetical protein